MWVVILSSYAYYHGGVKALAEHCSPSPNSLLHSYHKRDLNIIYIHVLKVFMIARCFT